MKPKTGDACVILMHGLGRTRLSMVRMARELERRGYRVWNRSYPSTQAPVEILARDYLAPAVARCLETGCRTVHMVGHSLGGILMRQYLQTHRLPPGSRIVMLAPPNQGSPVADRLKACRLYRRITGPAGQQLGTGVDGVPRRLRPVDATIGVIAGEASCNPLFSRMIPGPDDGQVAVADTRLAEMTDFIVLRASHTFIMSNRSVMTQTVHFLRHGRFDHGNRIPGPGDRDRRGLPRQR